ncbi:MAG: UbiX family flavin prenyltransferase [Desulfobacteraceae bacterium]|nr:UbiX family flavin prenyltransferase [Pseudomonadota bacterium]MCK4788847.1 UbiX family flavin prenyltransferase [Desulfobacteraceae bacterium]
MMKLIVGITGATGIIYGIRLLQVLGKIPEVEVYLIVSEAAKLTLESESDWTLTQLESLASHVYDNKDIGARISSGSFQTAGMMVIPCSIKTASSIANSFDYNLITRAADVVLKERRKLVLVVRETPLHLGHLKMMASLVERGTVILPPVPAFYHRPKNIDDIVDQTVGKVLDQFQIEHNLFQRWEGLSKPVIGEWPDNASEG